MRCSGNSSKWTVSTLFSVPPPAGRIYGVTFIDHSAGMSANGLVLGKEFSTNIFNKPIRRRRKRSGMLRNSIRSRSMRREAIKSIRSLESSTSYWIWPIPQAYEERQRQFCGGKDEEGASKIYRSSRKRGESDGNIFSTLLTRELSTLYLLYASSRERALIRVSSSLEKAVFSNARRLSAIWAVELAPMMTDVT